MGERWHPPSYGSSFRNATAAARLNSAARIASASGEMFGLGKHALAKNRFSLREHIPLPLPFCLEPKLDPLHPI